MRSSSLITFTWLTGALLAASGCSVITSLDDWTFGDDDGGHMDAGPMDAGPGEDAGQVDAGPGGDAGPDCAAGLTDCAGECVDLDSSPEHCGSCESPCPTPPNTVALCTDRSCDWECAAGFADCNGDPVDGCEIEIASDPLNCGACENSCVNDLASLSCREGTCRPKLLWADGFANANLLDIALDPEGNVYITGSFTESTNFGGDDLISEKTSAGTYSLDVFIASFTASGEHRWSRSGGGPGFDTPAAIAFDGSSSTPKVHVTGSFVETARFDQEPSSTDPETTDPLTSNGGSDIFVASFNAATGSHLGSRGWGGPQRDEGNGIAVDSNGSIYVTGLFSGSNVDFGGSRNRLSSTDGSHDIFVASYPWNYGSGTDARWSLGFGSTNQDMGEGIAVDENDHIYVVGTFLGNVSFGGDAFSSDDGCVFIASFNPHGNHQWSEQASSRHSNDSRIALDRHANIYIGGSIYGAGRFGPDTQEGSADYADMFIASYDQSGGYRWSHRATGPQFDFAYALAVSGSGEVYSVGRFEESIDFGGGLLTSPTGSEAAFLASYGGADGTHRASSVIGGREAWAHSYSVAATDEVVCIGGRFAGIWEMDDERLVSISDTDGFIACFEP